MATKDLPPGAVGDAVQAASPPTLRTPFPPSQVGKLPTAGIQLDYVGHGNVTARLLDVDPGWTWEPAAFGPDGLPLFDRDKDGKPIGLWIKLTANGTTRFGYGDCPSNQKHAEKVLIGDAIRNAAMRFGVALDLWMKGHSEDAEAFNSDGDLTVGQLYADDYKAKATKAGLSSFEIEDIVLGVTASRTSDVLMVFESERPALVERTRVVVAQKAPEGPQTAVEHGNSPEVAGEAPKGVWDK